MKHLAARVRPFWRVLWRSHQLEADMSDEMRFHVDMEADRLMREQRLDRDEARRRAFVAFGGIEKYKEQGRDARGRQWIDAIGLDTKLGVRMLIKHRGLTLIGGFAMAVAIAIGATSFELVSEVVNPALPFEDGDRVVALRYGSINGENPERRVLHDFVAWRDELVSIEQLGAFRTAELNLVSGNALPEPIRVAQITASAFTIGRTPPLTGRYLLPGDEAESASPVVVIGYQAWQLRFGADPQIVGRTVTLGGVASTIVGVMPDGFEFPVNHQFWVPLRANPLQYPRLQGPAISMFGRLAPGVTIEKAQAELATIGQRLAAAFPETHERLRPVVVPYTREHVDLTDPGIVSLLRIAQLFISALAFVVAVNLAILVYARTVTRLGEIAVRTALGASRRRILAQLFIESLALAVVGAVAGLLLSGMALSSLRSFAPAAGGVPFWIDFDLSLGTVLYAFGLAMLAAFIMGVLPGLKATGRSLNARLHELNGRMGTQLGGLWTTLVVAQVAVAVSVLPASVYLAWQVVQSELAGPGFAAEQFVVATVALTDEANATDSALIARRQLEIISRLEAEPGVSAVTFSSHVPGLTGGRRIQFEDPAIALTAQQRRGMDAGPPGVGTLHSDINLFDAYGAEILAGRAFNASDVGVANAVIVNRGFVEHFLQNRNPLGVRFQYAPVQTSSLGSEARQESYEIIGVVRDFPSFPPALNVDDTSVVYHPAAPGDVDPVVLSVRFNGTIPPGFTDRFRVIAAEVDPALQLRAMPLSKFYNDMRSLWRYLAFGLGLVTASVLLLSAAGIYALMSFTIAQRTREIGIRIALGAHPRRLLLSVFGRTTRQLAFGLLIGSLLSAAAFLNLELKAEEGLALLVTVAAIMLIVGLLATLGPARRSLRMQPTDALRVDG